MSKRSVRNFTVTLTQGKRIGEAWVVRVYRRGFPFRRRVSSDWFLDDAQAKTFADQVAKDLEQTASQTTIQNRPPGWRFRQ